MHGRLPSGANVRAANTGAFEGTPIATLPAAIVQGRAGAAMLPVFLLDAAFAWTVCDVRAYGRLSHGRSMIGDCAYGQHVM